MSVSCTYSGPYQVTHEDPTQDLTEFWGPRDANANHTIERDVNFHSLTISATQGMTANLSIRGNLVVKNLHIQAKADVEFNLYIAGNVEVTEALHISGKATLTGDLSVRGVINIKDIKIDVNSSLSMGCWSCKCATVENLCASGSINWGQCGATDGFTINNLDLGETCNVRGPSMTYGRFHCGDVPMSGTTST